MGEINKGMVALLVAVVLGAGGYLWHSMLYKPAVVKQTAAKTALDGALQAQEAAKSQLDAAEANLKADARKNVPPRDAIAKTSIARTAIPPDSNIGDAALVLKQIARTSGVQIVLDLDTSKAVDVEAAATVPGVTPIDITIEGASSYAEMVAFMHQVEGTVYAKGGKAFVNGRLFNVIKMEVVPPEEDNAAAAASLNALSPDFAAGADAADEASSNGLVFKKGDVHFTLTIRMYTKDPDLAGAADDALTDPSAAAAASLDPAAAAAAGTDPAAAAGTDPAAAGAAANTDTAAAGSPASTTLSPTA